MSNFRWESLVFIHNPNEGEYEFMPVYFAQLNEDVVIREITGSDQVKSHLANLGFVVGATVRVVSKVDDNLILKIKGVSMALNHDLAKRIII